MAGKRVRTMVGALMFGAMVGFRDATGLAPPPPVLTTEVVEWLSPEPEGGDDLDVVFADPTPPSVEDPATEQMSGRRGLFDRAARLLLGLFDRTG